MFVLLFRVKLQKRIFLQIFLVVNSVALKDVYNHFQNFFYWQFMSVLDKLV